MAETGRNEDRDLKMKVSEALRGVDANLARMAGDDMATVTVHPVSFLKRYSVCFVEYLTPSRPVGFFVGYAPGLPALRLTAAPSNFALMARAEALEVNSPDLAAEYATAYLEITRSMSHVFYLVRAVEDIQFLPSPSAEEERLARVLAEKYRQVVVPPVARSSLLGHTVTVYAMRQQELERHDLTVGPYGDVRDRAVVLEKNMPTIWGQ
jgi:hypothetical protein